MHTPRLSACLSITLLVLLSSLALSHAAQVQLSWDASTANADGTPLTDLAGYAVYYWQDGWDVPVREDAGTQTTYTVSGLTDGATYQFVVTALDTSGNESAFSNQVSATCPYR
jgi:chitodextrinase